MSGTPLTNQPVDELGRLAQAAREALTDTMVERLSVAGANALDLVDRLSEPGTGDALHALLDKVTELHKAGALDTLFDVVMLVHAARSAATDNIVERVFTFVEQMIGTIGSEAMGELAETVRVALSEAAEETARKEPTGGILAALSLLGRPETQRMLLFLLSFAGKVQQRTAGS